MKKPKPKSKPSVLASMPREEAQQLVTLFNAGRYADVELRARLLVDLYPATPFAWKILGTVLLVQGKDGLQALQKTVELLPTDAEAHSNLGNMYKALGRFEEAAASHQRAIALKPDHALAHYNLGIVLRDLGRSAEAVASFRKAIALKLDFTDAHFNLGIALTDLDRFEEAATSYRQALALQPKFLGAQCNLGIVLKDMGRYDEAVAAFQRLLDLKPDDVAAHNNLGNLLKDLGRLDEAATHFREALKLNPDYNEAASNLLFALNYVAGQQPEVLLNEAKAYGARIASRTAPHTQPYTSWANTVDAGRPLRIGLVSGDLNQHPVGFFMEGVLKALSSQAAGRLSLHAYATQARRDALTERLQACCDSWCVASGLSDQALAERIRADGIDILVDLSGHTAYNRLPVLALKPAPVQVTWLGYFATTGVAAIDYLLADPWTVPPAHEAHFTEQIWRLPDTRMCFTPPDADVPVADLPALSRGHITFGCFNNITKLNDEVVALWARVLKAVEGSRLMLKAKQLDEASVKQGLLSRFEAQGIDPQRVTLAGRSPRAEYLVAYGEVDIGLDPFPFTGGTTSAESLWMGVPVLTLDGDRLVSRQGVGLMMNAGLPDWVARDADDYVAKAVAHAADVPALAALRAGLRQQVLASPVFDGARFAHHLEEAWRGMWGKWCASGRDDQHA